ncbi:MAG TPA: DMT family transporter [Thermoleophilaceae bacterium]|nr:DMT family transporter [Thermoleophilaceae bacterium]
MDRRAWILLVVLASVWGASYLFIKLGLEDLSPAMVVFLRTLLAAVVLAPLALSRGAFTGFRGRLAPIFLLAAVQVAGPFLLISWGEEEISSSLAGILVASAPILTALLAVFVDQEERPSAAGAFGIGIGIVGVALLLGVDVGGESAALVGGLAVVLASLGYAIGGFYLKAKFRDTQPIGVVTATMLASALLVLPLALITFPSEAPGVGALAAMAALGAGGTGIAFVIFYTLIAEVGPAKASVVAYIAPVFAVIYGVAFLDEAFTLATLAGMALILGGSWIAGGGALPSRRRDRVTRPEAADDPARQAPPPVPAGGA